MGGWDTHVNEVGATQTVGPLANLLTEFGRGIAAFYQDLGDLMEEPALPGLLEGLERWVPNLRIQRVASASHWIVHEQPALVANLIQALLPLETD